jgi:isopentenyl phosphate kinase
MAMENHNPFYFLKLGGSLITDKDKPQTPRPDVLSRLAAEIQAARQANPSLRLLLGHGSGSFGHAAAKKHNTRQGVTSPAGWAGFVEVWSAANQLNRLVMDALLRAGVPALVFPPSSQVLASGGQLVDWNLTPIQLALQAGLVPVVHGDVVFDLQWGGTILSTEDLFTGLAKNLKPDRILLAGIEEGVWLDYPERSTLVSRITPQTFQEVIQKISGSGSIDVTGGMADKVRQSLALVAAQDTGEILIFSGESAGNVLSALAGDIPGTQILVDTLPTLD